MRNQSIVYFPLLLLFLLALAPFDTAMADGSSASKRRINILIPTRGSREAGVKVPLPDFAAVAGQNRASRAVNNANRKRFRADIARIAKKYRLEPALVDAVISAESAYDPKALSPAGAMGLMQLMPATAKRFGVADPYDPIANIKGGVRYLRILLDRFGDLELALAAYNAGENTVLRYGKVIPPYPETRQYVVIVLDLYRRYQKQAGAA